MSREVNVNDPASWSEQDKAWLRERIERVPEEHRHLLAVEVPPSPVRSVGDLVRSAARTWRGQSTRATR